jgi:hypothetical protein
MYRGMVVEAQEASAQVQRIIPAPVEIVSLKYFRPMNYFRRSKSDTAALTLCLLL